MFRSQEQKRFHDLIAKHIEVQDRPLLLEGGTGIGKTRAYLAALAGCGLRVAIVLPTHQLIDQLAASPDLEAAGLEVAPFRPARMFDSRAEYDAHRRKAMDARVMLCTAASVMIDQRLGGNYNGAKGRDYLLFDEADQLPEAAALQQDLTVTAEDLAAAGVALTTDGETVAALLAAPGIEPELRARAAMMKEALDEPAWFRKVGLDDDGGLVLWHRMPGRLLKHIANRGNAAFVSATLTAAAGVEEFYDFQRSMGIGDVSRLSGVIEPKHHGKLTVETPVERDPAEVIAGAERPCLVVTPSFKDAAALAARLPGAVVRETTPNGARERETTAEAADRVGEDGILIAVGAWAGLDTKLRWRSIVVPRIPFGKPTVLDDRIESRYIDSRNVATRRMRQVIGRGLRTPDAVCTLYVCDDRHRGLGRFVPARFRFETGWDEGGRVEVVLSNIERDPAVRRKALQRYGHECRACGYVPPGGRSSTLDVHHLDSLAEGPRNTKIEDVTVLCPTCHRLAHTETPPIPLDRLRTLRTQATRAG